MNKIKEGKIIYPELSYTIVGILYETHNELGRYVIEKQCADYIEQRLKALKINYEREKILDEYFVGEKHGRHRIDFFIDNKIVLELKCKRVITKEDYYQIKRYLSVLNKRLGLLVNFRDRYLKPRRILN